MELVADLKFILKSGNALDQLRNFGFIQEVSGKNVSKEILIMIFLICLTSLTRAKCGIPSTLCWKIPNISGSIQLFAL